MILDCKPHRVESLFPIPHGLWDRRVRSAIITFHYVVVRLITAPIGIVTVNAVYGAVISRTVSGNERIRKIAVTHVCTDRIGGEVRPCCVGGHIPKVREYRIIVGIGGIRAI